jgi:UDP-MurNAc hydroxylase
MQVTFLGHAGILIDSGSTRILMDGWFSREGAFDASWYQLPANHHLAERVTDALSAVIVSHEHLDHLDPAFLRSLPDGVPLYVVSYGSPLFVNKLIRLSGRVPRVLSGTREHTIGDICLRIWTEESPMNQDSVWVFRHGGRSIVHTVDSRLTSAQVEEVRSYTDRPDLLLVQCAGASWYPMVYESLDEVTRTSRSKKKREQKLSYALSLAQQLRPEIVICCAGPPAFLDPMLRYANDDPSFPTPGESRTWFSGMGYAGRVEAPLPGDSLDLHTGELCPDAAMHAAFAWEETPRYLEWYADQMRPHIEAVYRRAEALETEHLYKIFREHFERMLSLSPYFNTRISMTVCFQIEGDGGGEWLVDFGPNPGVRQARGRDVYQYRYRFHARWLKRILIDRVPWEDFFLSLRFAASRNPDVYNDHLLGLLKFNEPVSLRAVEESEKRTSTETIVIVAGDGTPYEISRYCPHAGADLSGAPVEGTTITCLNHHYTFDLETGQCLTGNCRLTSRRLSAQHVSMVDSGDGAGRH